MTMCTAESSQWCAFAANDVSLNELLWQRLPRVDVAGSLGVTSVQVRDKDRLTHPTNINHWSGLFGKMEERRG